AVLPQPNGSIKTSSLSLKKSSYDGVSVDSVCYCLTQKLVIPRFELRAHRQEHDLHGIHSGNFCVRVFLDSLPQMRRDELSDLYLSVEQGRNSLLGLSHNSKDDFIGGLFLILHPRIVQVLCDDQPLSRNEFPKLVRTSSERVLPISDFRAVLVIDRF